VSPLLVILLTFLGVALAVAGVCSILADLFVRDRSRVQRRLDDEFRQRQRDQIRRSAVFKDLGQLSAEASSEDAGETLRQRLEHVIEQANLNVTPRQILFLTIGFGLGAGGLVTLLRQSLVQGGIVGIVCAVLPLVYVRIKRNARIRRMTNQLPDAFDLMARVIRAGQTMHQAIQAVADEFQEPLAAEFTYCFEQQNLGLSPELSLRDLARRTGLLEIKIFVLALLVQQQSGGNLAELLEKLATIIRERFRIKDKISGLTAEGRMQALVLLLLPVVVLGAICVLNRRYAQSLLDNPGLLVGMFIAELVGAVWIRRIVNFDF
jgi:tight adherence protein B